MAEEVNGRALISEFVPWLSPCAMPGTINRGNGDFANIGLEDRDANFVTSCSEKGLHTAEDFGLQSWLQEPQAIGCNCRRLLEMNGKRLSALPNWRRDCSKNSTRRKQNGSYFAAISSAHNFRSNRSHCSHRMQ